MRSSRRRSGSSASNAKRVRGIRAERPSGRSVSFRARAARMGLVLRVRSGCVPVVPRPPARSPGRVRARLRCLVRCPGRVAPLSRVSRLAAPGRPARAIIARLCRPAQPCPGRAASAGCVFSQGHVQQKRRFGTAGSLRRGIPRRWRNATWGFASASFEEGAGNRPMTAKTSFLPHIRGRNRATGSA